AGAVAGAGAGSVAGAVAGAGAGAVAVAVAGAVAGAGSVAVAVAGAGSVAGAVAVAGAGAVAVAVAVAVAFHIRGNYPPKDYRFHGEPSHAITACGVTSEIEVTSLRISEGTFGPILQYFDGPVTARPRNPFTSLDQYRQLRAFDSKIILPPIF